MKNLFKRGSLSGEIEKDFYGNILKDLKEVNSKSNCSIREREVRKQ